MTASLVAAIVGSEIGPFATRWLVLLADISLKSCIVLAAAGLVLLTMQNASAATRHSVWALAFGGILILPLLATALPSWNFEMVRPPVLDHVPRGSAAKSDASELTGFAIPGTQHTTQSGSVMHDAPKASRVKENKSVQVSPSAVKVGAAFVDADSGRWSAGSVVAVFVLWSLGVAVVLGMLITGLVRTSLLARRSAPVLESAWLRMRDRLCRRLAISRPVVLLRSGSAVTPATWGVFRPVILVPADADHWSDDRRRDVLVHELAHIKRFDFLTQIIARYVCALFWFNPLLWLAARQMRIERERACDDEVLLAGTKPSAYAGHLLATARSVRRFSAVSFSRVAMANRSHLPGRLHAILEQGRRRGALSPFRTAIIWFVGFVLILPVASVRAVWARPNDAPLTNPTQPRVTPAVPLIDRAPARAVEPNPRVLIPRTLQEPQAMQWAAAPQCREIGEDGSRGVNEQSSNGRLTSRWWDGNCEGEVRLRGEVRFTRDYNDVESVPSSGMFSVEINADGDSRRVEIRPDGQNLQRRWYVNGREAPHGEEAQSWLSLALRDFFRHSSYDLDRRVDALLARGGVAALLREAESAHGGYLSRRFYAAAIETGELNPNDIDRILRRAMQSVTSDYEMARLLQTIPANDLRNPALRQTYVQAANTVESDYERARVLITLLQQDGLETDVVRMLLASAAEIESDYELARLLTTLGARYLREPVTREAYLSAANSIESDFELQRVLASLLETDNLTVENLQMLLASAGNIESDYEAARLLVGVADKFLVDESLRRSYFAAVERIESDYERQRVLTTLVARDGLPVAVVADAIRSAMSISGDYAKATVLRAIASRYRNDAGLRDLLEQAAETISSEYEYGRVMAAIRGRRT